MPNKFSEYTRKIQDRLPYWFKEMKTNEESIGAQFLNVFGLAIEEVAYMLDYAYKQTNLLTADTNQISLIYKAFCPIPIAEDYRVEITSHDFILYKCETLEQFISALDTDSIYSEIRFPNPFLIDMQKYIIYVRFPYDATEEYKDGIVRIKIYDINDNEIFDNPVPLSMHPVWNYFDEFGLLFGLQRMFGEDNLAYKNRLLDVFIHPASTSIYGLINGISRELGLRKTLTWENGSLDYRINDKMVIINSIEVDGSLVDEDLIYVDILNGQIVIKGNSAYRYSQRTISYAYGFSMHQLHNKEDKVFYNQIKSPGSPLLKYINDKINNEAPILWNKFVWDEGHWDIDQNVVGRLPVLLDALIARQVYTTLEQYNDMTIIGDTLIIGENTIIKG